MYIHQEPLPSNTKETKGAMYWISIKISYIRKCDLKPLRG